MSTVASYLFQAPLNAPRLIADQIIAERIQERRKLLHLERRVVAEWIGVTPRQLYKYERGETSVSVGLLYQIASALGTSPEYFFNGLEEQAPAPLSPAQRLLFDLVCSLRKIERREHWEVLRDVIRNLTNRIAMANNRHAQPPLSR